MLRREDMMELTRRMTPSRSSIDRIAGFCYDEEGIGHCNIYGATAGLVQNKDLLAKLELPEGFTLLGAIELGKTNESYTERTIPDAHRFSTNKIR